MTRSALITGSCGGVSVTDTISVPTFHNYVLVSATIGTLNGSIQPSVNDNRTAETTTVTFTAIDANQLVVLTFAEQSGSPTYATVATCATNGGHNQINNPTWNKPWLN